MLGEMSVVALQLIPECGLILSHNRLNDEVWDSLAYPLFWDVSQCVLSEGVSDSLVYPHETKHFARLPARARVCVCVLESWKFRVPNGECTECIITPIFRISLRVFYNLAVTDSMRGLWMQFTVISDNGLRFGRARRVKM